MRLFHRKTGHNIPHLHGLEGIIQQMLLRFLPFSSTVKRRNTFCSQAKRANYKTSISLHSGVIPSEKILLDLCSNKLINPFYSENLSVISGGYSKLYHRPVDFNVQTEIDKSYKSLHPSLRLFRLKFNTLQHE